MLEGKFGQLGINFNGFRVISARAGGARVECEFRLGWSTRLVWAGISVGSEAYSGSVAGESAWDEGGFPSGLRCISGRGGGASQPRRREFPLGWGSGSGGAGQGGEVQRGFGEARGTRTERSRVAAAEARPAKGFRPTFSAASCAALRPLPSRGNLLPAKRAGGGDDGGAFLASAWLHGSPFTLGTLRGAAPPSAPSFKTNRIRRRQP